jgi:hypothetical protein
MKSVLNVNEVRYAALVTDSTEKCRWDRPIGAPPVHGFDCKAMRKSLNRHESEMLALW